MDTILELLKLGAVGIIAGLFAAVIAVREHREKKWWELRVAAYPSVIEALSDLSHYYDQIYKAEIGDSELSKEREAELAKFWNSGYHRVRKAADSGIYLFSTDVNQALKAFMALKNVEHFSSIDYLEGHLAEANTCREKVVSLANKDLRVQDSWFKKSYQRAAAWRKKALSRFSKKEQAP